MSIFDKLKKSAMDAVKSAASSIGNKSETFTFAARPESLAEMQGFFGLYALSPHQIQKKGDP